MSCNKHDWKNIYNPQCYNLICKNCNINIYPIQYNILQKQPKNNKIITLEEAIIIVSKEYGEKLIKTYSSIQHKCNERNYSLMLVFYHEKEEIISKIKSLYPNTEIMQSNLIKMVLDNIKSDDKYKKLLDKYIMDRIDNKIDSMGMKEQYFHLLDFINKNC